MESNPGDFFIGVIHQPLADQSFIEKFETFGGSSVADSYAGRCGKFIKFIQPVFRQDFKYSETTVAAKELLIPLVQAAPAGCTAMKAQGLLPSRVLICVWRGWTVLGQSCHF